MWVLLQRSFRPWPPSCLSLLSGGPSAGPRKSRLRLRIVWLIFAATLVTPGCASLAGNNQERGATALPVRPALTSLVVTPEGGIMMDKRDAAELLIYIEALERACGVGQ